MRLPAIVLVGVAVLTGCASPSKTIQATVVLDGDEQEVLTRTAANSGTKEIAVATTPFEKFLIRVNKKGLMLPSSAYWPNVMRQQFLDPIPKSNIDKMIDGLIYDAEKNTEKQWSKKGMEGPIKLMIYVHGGLNSFEDTDAKIIDQNLPCEIMNDENDWNYTVFISRPSSYPHSPLHHGVFDSRLA
jgi:hypothetical protein